MSHIFGLFDGGPHDPRGGAGAGFGFGDGDGDGTYFFL
jgi:hypothetical protein